MVEGRIAERRAEVRAARRRARLRRTLLVLLGGAVLAGAIWFEQSEHATIDRIVVLGVDRLDPDDVVATSGAEVGGHLLRIRPSRIEERVEGVALVRTAEVSRTWSRVLTIVVEERAPVYVAEHRGVAVLVDRDGVVVDRGRDPRLATVRLASLPPEPGELVFAHASLANAHRVWTGLSGPLRSQLLEVRAPDEDGLELVLDGAPVVRFGRAEMLEEKVRALGVILDDVAGSEVTLIDVRVPSFPVVRID
jgi:cell division protein FtsQ